MQRKSQRYKWCFVPCCRNTSITTPHKDFVFMPTDLQVRESWFRAARRKITAIPKTELYCCEDHFNMQEDMENYMYHKMMGVRLKVKSNVVPHIFDFQLDLKRPISGAEETKGAPVAKKTAGEASAQSSSVHVKEEDGLEEMQENKVALEYVKVEPFWDGDPYKVNADVGVQTEIQGFILDSLLSIKADKECDARPHYQDKSVQCNLIPKTKDTAV